MAEIHPAFKINGSSCDEFLSQSFENDRLKGFQQELRNFKVSYEFRFHTSGTTGAPKEITFSIDQIVASARATHKTFGLFKGAVAVNALPLKYVASKMMLFRAMICGYSLYVLEPDFNEKSFKGLPVSIDFFPLVPVQLEKILNFEKNLLPSMRKVLIGGATVSSELKERILGLQVNTRFFESFGSTETLTHIGIRRIGETSFKSIFGVSFSSENSRLIIHAPHILKEAIITNDLVELTSSESFKWLGRADNVINSGGIKIIPEQLEIKIAAVLKSPFFISAEPSELLGQQIILVIESAVEFDIDWSKIEINKYEIPKKIYFLPQLNKTESGKIIRSIA
jgi:O-succinylbenzoic acid--CoA ligase